MFLLLIRNQDESPLKRTMGKGSVSWRYLLKLSQFKVCGLQQPAGAVFINPATILYIYIYIYIYFLTWLSTMSTFLPFKKRLFHTQSKNRNKIKRDFDHHILNGFKFNAAQRGWVLKFILFTG